MVVILIKLLIQLLVVILTISLLVVFWDNYKKFKEGKVIINVPEWLAYLLLTIATILFLAFSLIGLYLIFLFKR